MVVSTSRTRERLSKLGADQHRAVEADRGRKFESSSALLTKGTPELIEVLSQLLVVCSKGLDYGPHWPEDLVVVDGILGVNRCIDQHRENDRANLLLWREANGPAYGLHDVNLRAPRVDERNSIDRRNIYAFTQAARIG